MVVPQFIFEPSFPAITFCTRGAIDSVSQLLSYIVIIVAIEHLNQGTRHCVSEGLFCIVKLYCRISLYQRKDGGRQGKGFRQR